MLLFGQVLYWFVTKYMYIYLYIYFLLINLFIVVFVSILFGMLASAVSITRGYVYPCSWLLFRHISTNLGVKIPWLCHVIPTLVKIPSFIPQWWSPLMFCSRMIQPRSNHDPTRGPCMIQCSNEYLDCVYIWTCRGSTHMFGSSVPVR